MAKSTTSADAPTTVTLRNVSPLGDLDIPLLGTVVPAGETFEVTFEQAGRPPSGDPTQGTYDPGEGLLAQPLNYELVSTWTPPAPVVKDFNQAVAATPDVVVDEPTPDASTPDTNSDSGATN